MENKTSVNQKNRFIRGVVLGFAAFVIAIAAMLITGLVILDYVNRPTGELAAEGLTFTVETGATGTSVARSLQDQGAIRSELFFSLLLRLSAGQQTIKSGIYKIQADQEASEILAMLLQGKQILQTLRIPEGRSLRQIAQLAEQAGITSAQGFIAAARNQVLLKRLNIPGDSAEGYLFPDTYHFVADSDPETVVGFLVQRFFQELESRLPEARELSAADLHRKVILASIIEREYRQADEAALMAGVFLNRLDRNMLLQSCATVVYVITEELQRPHPSRLFNKDLEIQSPYNTYLYAGLPPAPICSPGSVALTAAMRPKQSDYLYFRLINEDSGKHYFSESFDQHIAAANLFSKP